MAVAHGFDFGKNITTVGTGVLGFGGLNVESSVLRWFQSYRAPDLGFTEIAADEGGPIMFLLIIVEIIIAAVQGEKVYYLRQLFSNGAAGALMFVIFGVFFRGLSVFPYVLAYHYLGLRITNFWVNHILAFFAVDFAYYCAHCMEHKTNIGWAVHNMHHSSPDFNFSTGLRQAPELCIHWIFYMPLALFVPPKIFYLHYGFNYFYQFLVHTPLIHKLPWIIELIFNTPSHHRVHHARNYPRANFAGMLIIWDRMCGTFVPEIEGKKPWYGLDDRQVVLDTHNVVWQQMHHMWQTIRVMIKSDNKLKVIFTRVHGADMIAPAVTDAGVDMVVKIPKDGIPCDPRALGWNDLYMAFHMLAVCLPMNLFVKDAAVTLPPLITAVICANLVLTYIAIGVLYDDDKKQYAWKYELCRLLLVYISGVLIVEKHWANLIGLVCALSGLAAFVIYRPRPAHQHED